MGDKYKSEIQKPVNNPLLSGAGHGFPFETFQGSSLLVPVTQDNPSVLTDQVGEPDKFVGQDVPFPDGSESNEAHNITVGPKEDQKSTQSPTGNQRYVRLFNAFFGGGGKSDQEIRPERGIDQQSTTSVSSTPRSFSPYIPLPNFQTVTPALQVPTVSNASSPAESLSTNPLHPIGQEAETPNKNPKVSDLSEVQQTASADGSQLPTQSGFVVPDQSSGFTFGSFQNTGYRYQNSNVAYPPSTHYPPSQTSQQSNWNHDGHIHDKPIPPPGLPFDLGGSDVSKPPLSNPNAPPLFRDSSKTYRLSHNKRPVYAPIPGLTLSSSSTSSFLHMSETPSASYPNPTAATTQPVAHIAPTVAFPPQPPVYSTHPGTGSQPTAYVAPTITSSQQALFSPLSTSTSHSTSGVSSESSSNLQSKSCPPLPAAGLQQTTFFSSSTLGFSQSTAFPFVTSTISQPSGPRLSSQFYLRPSAEPSRPNIQSFYFDPLSVGDSFQSTMTSSAPNQPVPPQHTTPTQEPSFHPSNSDSSEKQNLFAPISIANPQPQENNPIVNPVAVHPSGNLPTNLRPQTPKNDNPSPAIVPPSLSNLAHVGRTGIAYRPPYHHWFYKKETDSKEHWYPFSMTDSVALEQAYQSASLDENTVIPTDGGRYDVNIIRRTRTAIYWEESPKEARRCSWFYKNQKESKFKPYDENTAYHLEEEYKKCVTTDTWRKTINLNSGDYVVLYSTTNMAHFESNIPMPDGWEGDFADGSQPLPFPVRMVKRGISDDFDIDDGESPRVDHLVFVVHGIGSVCDLKFRTIEEAVDVFRSFSQKLCRTHFSNSMKQGLVNRIEILPISWHSHIHGETTGLDKRLESITLKSIPRLRNFTNDTLLDILFYTSPVYCQNIVKHVGREITRIYEKFKTRNPNFSGGVSLVGHSLGSLILFDMLCHQKPQKTYPEPTFDFLKPQSRLTRRMSGYVIGNVETQEPYVEYPQLPFQPVALFALGSPIGMFITVRGINSLGKMFALPTCPRFFNIFHPFDPVAYRIEALINPEMSNKRPVLIPHHKGRKRMHLELKETLSRVGADLKQRLVDSIRSTWNTVYQLTAFGRADDGLEQEVDQVIEKQIAGSESAVCLIEQESTPCDVGVLNQGRRVDFVLQEAPLESFNEYVSAIRSHLIYWDSEDTILMILREIYNAEGITADAESVIGQDSAGSNSPSTAPAAAPGVGWNINDDQQQKSSQDGQAPSYGFIKE